LISKSFIVPDQQIADVVFFAGKEVIPAIGFQTLIKILKPEPGTPLLNSFLN
jgi:hypothetical protein